METKICSKCKKQLPITDFYWRNRQKGIRRSDCKDCHNNYVKIKYLEKRQDIEKLKSLFSCAKCGDDRGYVLDFHHKDPSLKKDGIANLISSNANLQTIKKEIDKCIVLCANCHREFHYLNTHENVELEDYLNNNCNIKYSFMIQQTESIPIQWKQTPLKKKENFCIDCGKKISRGATRCAFCANKNRRKSVQEITREELKQKIRTMPFTQIGLYYGMSDNAIKKWCDKFNLPRTKKEIKTYSDEEWNLI